ncbi:MAG TPA: hypothetical protein VF421_07935 [Niabella sp.]
MSKVIALANQKGGVGKTPQRSAWVFFDHLVDDIRDYIWTCFLYLLICKPGLILADEPTGACYEFWNEILDVVTMLG